MSGHSVGFPSPGSSASASKTFRQFLDGGSTATSGLVMTSCSKSPSHDEKQICSPTKMDSGGLVSSMPRPEKRIPPAIHLPSAG